MPMFSLFLVTVGLALQSPPSPAKPPDVTAIARFHQVDGRLYRGAQPDAEGLRQLRALGIHAVINLRSEEDTLTRQEQRVVESLGMRYVPLPIADGNFFTRSRVVPPD